MKFAFIGIPLIMLLSSCSSNYEKAIADWIQTDKDGTWTDMKFKVIEVQATKDLTVADSVQILKKRFDKARTKAILGYEHDLKVLESFLHTAEYVGATQQVQKTEDKLKKSKNDLDSLQSAKFQSDYDDRDSTEVLAKFIKCKYSIFSPLLQTKQEKVETFLLTPDMEKCLGRMEKNI